MKVEKEIKNLIILTKYHEMKKLSNDLRSYYTNRAKLTPLAYAKVTSKR